MLLQKHLPFVGLVVLLLSAYGLMAFDVPREPLWGVIFTGSTLLYSAWLTVRYLRGPDEVRSAAMRFGLIFGSWMGLTISMMAVVMMLAVPGFAEFITRIAMHSQNDLSPANVGFGLGVLSTVVAMMVFVAVGHTGWWLMKR